MTSNKDDHPYNVCTDISQPHLSPTILSYQTTRNYPFACVPSRIRVTQWSDSGLLSSFSRSSLPLSMLRFNGWNVPDPTPLALYSRWCGVSGEYGTRSPHGTLPSRPEDPHPQSKQRTERVWPNYKC